MRHSFIYIACMYFLASCATTSFPTDVHGQGKPFLKTTSDANQTAYLFYQKTARALGLPSLSDTMFLGGLDSLGSALWVKSGTNKGLWIRDSIPTGGHVWKKMAASSDLINYWTLSGSNLYNNSGSKIGINTTAPAFTLDIGSGSGRMYFTGSQLGLYDNTGNKNLMIGDSSTGSQNSASLSVMLGTNAGTYLNGFHNTALGRSALFDAEDDNNVAVGGSSGLFASGQNTSVGFQSNHTDWGNRNIAVGYNAVTADSVLSRKLPVTIIGVGTTTFTGSLIATYITDAGYSVGDTAVFEMNFLGTPPNIFSANIIDRKGIVTASNTITFFPINNFADQGTDSVILTCYTRQSNAIVVGTSVNSPGSNWITMGNSENTFFKIGTAIFNMQSTIHEGWVLMNHGGVYVPDTIAGGGGGALSYTLPLVESGGTVSINAATTSLPGVVTPNANDFNLSGPALTIDYVNGQQSTNSLNGFLSAADHTTYSGYATSKQDVITGAISPYVSSNAIASRLIGSDGSGKFTTLSVTTAEASYLSGVSAPIQTQFSQKISTTLADGKILIGSPLNLATAQTVSGDGTLSNAGVFTLATVLSAGSCSDCILTYDAKGRILTAADGSGGGGGTGTVQLVTATLPVIVTGTPTVTPNIEIRLSKADGATTGAAAFTTEFADNGAGLIRMNYSGMQVGTSLVPGLISATDWTNFNNKVSSTRTISTTSPLSGGGDFSANRTLSIGGLSSIGTANYIVGVNAGATAWEYKQLIAGSNITITPSVGGVTIASTASGGVISVGLAAPTGFTVSGSPVTGTGTLTFSTTLNGIIYGNGANTLAAATISSPLTFSAGTLSIPAATNSVGGYLTNTDHALFAGKQDLITGWASTGVSANFTTNRVAISNAAGKADVSTATTSDLLNIIGGTSNFQVQINNKEPAIIYPFQTIAFNSGSPNVDCNLGYHASITLTGNATVSFSNFADGHILIFYVTQDLTGGRKLILPNNSFAFDGDGSGINPTLSSAGGATDAVSIQKRGSNYYYRIAYNAQ